MADTAAKTNPAKTNRLADVIDAVRWDYDPEEADLSPLVSAERYFRDFPWEGEDDLEADPAESPTPNTESA